MRGLGWRWLSLCVLAMGLACAHHGARGLQRESFLYAWTRIRDTYPYPDFHGLDWLALREELEPQAARARDASELRPILEEMFARLGDSHFAVIPGGLAPSRPGLERREPAQDAGGSSPLDAGAPLSFGGMGELGLDLRVIEGEAVISRVDAGGPAEQGGLRTGELVRSVDGLTVEAVLAELSGAEAQRTARAILLARMGGVAGSVARIEVEGGDGQVRALELKRTRGDAPWIALGSLPATPVHFHSEALPDKVGLIRFDVFMEPVPERFTSAMETLIAAGVRGVVLDLRGNPGGVAPMAMGMAGHFIGQRGQSLGVLRFREATWNLLVNPRAALFTGPLAVLVDGLSASTSEIMAVGLQKLGRARIFGETSAGMALPSTWERLPNGDLMQFVTGDYTASDGTRPEREGVHPDEPTPLTREALLAGRDPALDAARAWILSAAEKGETP